MPMSPIPSRMAIRGHPLHPVLIHLPIAALLMLVASDLAYAWTDDPFWARASLWLAGIGTIGGAISGLIGLLDLLLEPRIRRLVTAAAHAILAVTLLSLASLNFLLRWLAPEANILPWGLYLSLLTGALIAVTGLLGGQLVYEFGVGVDVEEIRERELPP